MGLFGQLKHAWNAFLDQEAESRQFDPTRGASYGTRPDRVRLRISNERSIISAIYMRLAVDCASIDIRHVRLDEQKRYKEDIESGLQNCLQLEANIDQAAQAFLIDAYLSMFDEGCIALVPVDAETDPLRTRATDIQTMRVAKIVQWYPRHVRVELYNDRTGMREQVTLFKSFVAIIENPLYLVMNEPNSTLQRLIRVLTMMDQTDAKNSANKLDMVIQLPYTIKTEHKRQQAEQRRKDVEFQLTSSQHGIAYIDATEKVVQLNRPIENNFLKQVEYFTAMLYSQLGLTAEVMLGTADEAAMLNYQNRTLLPIVTAFVQEIKRKFTTKSGRTQGQSVESFRDPFKLVPMKDLAEMADKFIRNEVVTNNEFRGFIGLRPSDDPKADELGNPNLYQPGAPGAPTPAPGAEEEADVIEDPFAGINEELDKVFAELGAEG